MSTGYTPGPWIAEPIKPHCLRFSVSGPPQCPGDDEDNNRSPVAIVDAMACNKRSPAWEECQANARLIAAAPLLLEVTRMLLAVSQSAINRGEFGPNVTRAARIAVAKATGAA